MDRVFTYTRITNQYYLDSTDEWEEDGEDFEYEPEYDDLVEQIAKIIYCVYNFKDSIDINKKYNIIDKIKEFIVDFDFVDILFDEYYDELKDIFKDEAFEQFN